MIIRVQGASEAQNGFYYEYDNESHPLGQGGMGIVYEGYCFRNDNRNEYIPVAIKKITNTTPDLIERAMREASIQIDHPNLLRMWGFIPNQELDPYTNSYRTQYYVVMDRLVGVDLFSLMKGLTIDKSGYNVEYAQSLYNLFISDRLEFVKVVMTGAMEAISTLHGAGYIHRDIDPSNVMITGNREIKLIDFGISKTFSSLYDTGHKLTQTGAIIGKADYAAPEIVTGDIQHHNMTTDIYALGVMLYQLCTGSLPFAGTDLEIMQSHLTQTLPLKNVAWPSLRKVIERATQKKQSARYQSVDEMKDDFIKAVGTVAENPMPGPAPVYEDPVVSAPSATIVSTNPFTSIADAGTPKATYVEDSSGHTLYGNESAIVDDSASVKSSRIHPWVWAVSALSGIAVGFVIALFIF